MESKHTPGPWRIGDAGCTVFGPKTDEPAPKTVASITRNPMPSNEQRANAALIAAAPDMRHALAETADRLSAWSDSLREWVNHDQGTPEKREEWQNEADNYDRLLALIMPALAKAEGR